MQYAKMKRNDAYNPHLNSGQKAILLPLKLNQDLSQVLRIDSLFLIY